MTEKAQIRVLDGPRQGEIIKVMYNPPEYSDERTSDINKDNNLIQFNRLNIPDFSVKLFYDTYERQKDVRAETDKIVSLMEPCEVGKNISRPPRCLFIWGSFSYEGIIIKCSRRFMMFLASGIPVREELSVTFTAVLSEEKAKKLDNRSSSRKFWTVKSSDRLDLIADSTYHDPALWRVIAEANRIEDPLAFPQQHIGRILMIPEREA